MKVVYNSFAGRYSDNPRAIYEALAADRRDVSHLWLSDPKHAHCFPAGVDSVPYGSRQSIRALESADMVVSNTYLPFEWDKSPGAVYLQTWHGTPLKQIHFDLRTAALDALEDFSRDVRRWDYLLSPNAASTGPLRGAFAFAGEVAETGYPRNDVLSAPHRDQVRARVRQELGIAPDATVVLYTPTYRDDVLDENGHEDFRLHLDLDDFTERLGDHVLLLRLHYLVSDRLPPPQQPNVRDVSLHPEVSDLYLAADVMVTDYSSTMFDFAVTGKPLLFFTYDLAHYRDSLRGFYFDFARHAPGPLLPTSREVVDALADLGAVQQRYAAAYARMQRRFCHLEDGRATSRVLQRLFPSPEALRHIDLTALTAAGAPR